MGAWGSVCAERREASALRGALSGSSVWAGGGGLSEANMLAGHRHERRLSNIYTHQHADNLAYQTYPDGSEFDGGGT